MRFLVDESTGAAVVEYLRNSGHDVLAVAEIIHQAEDPHILTLASSERAFSLGTTRILENWFFALGKLITASYCSGSAMKVRRIACG
jgi:hypothetical protein